jgi:hypothetical protein
MGDGAVPGDHVLGLGLHPGRHGVEVVDQDGGLAQRPVADRGPGRKVALGDLARSLKGLQLVDVLIQGGDHDHGGVAPAAQFAQHVPAVPLGHADVQQDQVGLQGGVQVGGHLPVGGADRAEALATQIGVQDLGDLDFVFGIRIRAGM